MLAWNRHWPRRLPDDAEKRETCRGVSAHRFDGPSPACSISTARTKPYYAPKTGATQGADDPLGNALVVRGSRHCERSEAIFSRRKLLDRSRRSHAERLLRRCAPRNDPHMTNALPPWLIPLRPWPSMQGVGAQSELGGQRLSTSLASRDPSRRVPGGTRRELFPVRIASYDSFADYSATLRNSSTSATRSA